MKTLSNERLQKAVNLFVEHDLPKAAEMLNIKASSLERMMREARIRGMETQIQEEVAVKPNVLVLDIETSLMQFFAWSPGKQYLGPSQIVTDWQVLSWAVKWLFEPDVYSDVVTPEEVSLRDDKRIIESVWQFLDKADIVIIHNARFDVRKLNARFIYHNMPPPSPYKVVDTLLAMRSQALFSSNKQEELTKKLGERQKVEHEGYNLWVRCFNGEPEALLTMEEYNKGDILSLEDLYVRIRPYIKSHPNMNLFVEGDGNACPNCGSKEIKWMDKFYATTVNLFSCFRCKSCGAVGRSPKSALGKTDKPSVVSVAR